MKKYNFKYKSLSIDGPYSNGFHLLGLILLPVGVFLLIAPVFIEGFESLEQSLFVGIGALVLGLIILSTYGGVMVSFKDRKIKEYYSLCGYKTGEWLPLSEQVSIDLRSFSYKSTNTPNGISPTLSGKVIEYRTFLYSRDSDEPMVYLRYTNKAQAVKEAKLLSIHLEADLTIPFAEEGNGD